MLIGVLFVSSGCTPHQMETETTFFRDFSLDQVVKKLGVPELKPSNAGTGTGTSSGDPTRRRRDFRVTLVLEERSARFDEASFMKKLRDEISMALTAANLRVHNSGTSGDDNFHFDYSNKEHEGWLDVTGARVEGNKYKLWGVLREDAHKDKKQD